MSPPVSEITFAAVGLVSVCVLFGLLLGPQSPFLDASCAAAPRIVTGLRAWVDGEQRGQLEGPPVRSVRVFRRWEIAPAPSGSCRDGIDDAIEPIEPGECTVLAVRGHTHLRGPRARDT